MEVIVLGSGPASMFCSLALVEAGAHVCMIDPGEVLEKARQDVLHTVQGVPKARWTSDVFRMVKENTNPNTKGVPKKLVYGSDFPFRWREDDVEVRQEGVDTLMSHALGGLSNAWGANIFPLLPGDTAEWPISMPALDPFYRRVCEYLTLAGVEDDLAEIFPLHATPKALPVSEQARLLLEDARANRSELRRNKMFIGRSRLAVRAQECVACGLCLYGCPHQLIFSASHLLPRLLTYPNFSYRSGWLAKRISEGHDGVSVEIRSVSDGVQETCRAEKVYVGCGAVNSTALALRSFHPPGTSAHLLDSQYFLTPFLRMRGSSGVLDEELHTLSQLALEILDPALCDRSVHVLFYTYNDMYTRALTGMLGPLAGVAKPFLKAFLGRLLIMQGYLHSDYSGQVRVQLDTASQGHEQLLLTPVENERTKPMVRAIHRRMRRMCRTFRGLPIDPMCHIGGVGKSYHLGGSMPMSLAPQGLQTDLLGRPVGLKSVHIVDASIFPSIPATNVTFTAMANAYRIGKETVG